MPSITQLEYILAVHRYGHFGRAAEACHVSQPTLSGQIRKAEEELEVTIFSRRTKPVLVTERGAAVIEQAQVVVAAHQRLLRMARGRFEQLAGTLRLAVIPTLAPYVLPWFVRPFATAHPLVELSIEERTTDEIVAGLNRQIFDIGLLSTPLREPRMRERRLFVDPFHVYAAALDPLLERDAVSLDDLDPCRMWLLEEGHCMRDQIIALCGTSEGRLLSTVLFQAGSFETLRNLIDATGGYTIIPQTFADRLPPQRRARQVRPFSGRIPAREVGLIHLKNTWKSDLFDALEQCIDGALPDTVVRRLPDAVVLEVRPG